jgi:sortase A
MRLAKVLGAMGRACITVGTLLLLFVVYQLWGTGIREAQAQNRLEADFEELLDEGNVPTTSPEPETVTSIPAQPEGEVTAVIEIPDIGLTKAVVEGVSVEDLKKGPGHYPETPLPGQEGNAAIAGHRTTYGAPFRRIDQLKPQQVITIDMPDGRFVYRVEQTKIVDDQDLSVLEPVGHQRLMLSACHPLYSAAERVIVFARLAHRGPPRVRRS